MPIGIYAGFLGRCLLASREYAALKNSVIERVPGSSSLIEILCHPSEATLLLDRARRFYPAAVPSIEEALEDLLTPDSPSEYRKTVSGDTWHFCSDCSHWPVADYVSIKNLPENATSCNECVVKSRHGECE
jgi:hypothetical protein